MSLVNKIIRAVFPVHRCRKCNRVLYSRASRRAGYGATCGKHFRGAIEHAEAERQGQMCFPGLERTSAQRGG